MTEMPYFQPHSLTVTAPSTANFVSIFESQTVSWQSAQVPSQHCIRGKGGGEGWEGAATVKECGQK